MLTGFYIVDDRGVPQHVDINPVYHGPCDICGGEYSHWDACDVEDVSFFETREKAEYYCGYAGDAVKQVTLGEEKV